MTKGKFIVFDGLDGVGKGTFIEGAIEALKDNGLKIFDVHKYWLSHHKHPNLKDFEHADVIITSEPTYIGIGLQIRDELTSKSSAHKYSTQVIANAYAMDRMILHEAVIIPAINAGIHVIQSRSIASSLIYQKVTGQSDIMLLEEIMDIDGNKLALENRPDYLFIPTIKNIEELQKRLKNREKDDDCIFENLNFQLKLKKEYESEEFKKIFESRGTKIEYLDASISIEHSKKQGYEAIKELLLRIIVNFI